MKKKIAITMCFMLLLFATCMIVPQQQEHAPTEYFATSFNGASDFTDKVFTV